jgi:tetratricopeptide (TPR) repeat protein
MAAFEEARDTFSRLNEQGSVAGFWHQIGRVHQEVGQPVLAEEAYNQSLAIKVRIGNQAGQATTLVQLGILYDDVLQRPEEAVAFQQRAAELYRAIGDTAGEWRQWNNLAISLHKLQRLEEARDAITRAIQCDQSYWHAAETWKTWGILADIETEASNPTAAAEARQKARAAYLAYRRDGGENHFGSGRLAQAIYQALSTGDPAAAASLLQQLAADPQAAHLRPFLSALQAITAGSRDPSLAEDPGLHYSEAAELVLLIEALEGGVSS